MTRTFLWWNYIFGWRNDKWIVLTNKNNTDWKDKGWNVDPKHIYVKKFWKWWKWCSVCWINLPLKSPKNTDTQESCWGYSKISTEWYNHSRMHECIQKMHMYFQAMKTPIRSDLFQHCCMYLSVRKLRIVTVIVMVENRSEGSSIATRHLKSYYQLILCFLPSFCISPILYWTFFYQH